MEILGHIALAIIIGLMVFAAFSLGLTLLVLFMGTAIIMAFLFTVSEAYRRWRFVQEHEKQENPPGVIETEYKDITDK